ncbi:phosphate/phosphite/phosphonate ABC transporter substrate-binding protein [Halobiforma nitratireducens]|uniref:Phosphonate ABC transporter substrate-binding protein n=1 Tax=Halobiforma nitratireducens JCM 10879 TaxID=1227454 RepID=M0MIU1_9EURY|nr:phosphate/phosphite/phosphonate ABC transporter substrate-binding protein [Halobiforma nitratireducens]EMA44644.1 phosphonate ABC transporter substrate-binding protein [Halobiforma nitratireducens JCM 10879]
MADRHATQGGRSSRRTFVLATGTIGTSLLAGCLDGDDGGGQAGAGLGGDSGSDSGEPRDPMLSTDFDPESPDWENNNYLGGLIDENDFVRGTEFDLENMGDRGRTEAVYGTEPRDHPDDPSAWIDPDPIVYADLPREDSEQAYADQLEPMIEKLEAETGRSVEFQTIESYAAVVEGMRSERIHIANFATGNTPFGVNMAGMVPLAMGIEGDGEFGYRLLAITRAGLDDIQSVEDFNDFRAAHTEESSNSGNQAPSALFDEHFGLTRGENYDPEMSGGHEQSARGIAYGDYDCGPICSTCIERTIDAVDDISWDDFKVVWAADPFPSGPVGYRYNLHEEIIEGARETFLNTDWPGTVFGEEAGYPTYVEVDYVNHWHDVMLNQQYNGVEYDEANL